MLEGADKSLRAVQLKVVAEQLRDERILLLRRLSTEGRIQQKSGYEYILG